MQWLDFSIEISRGSIKHLKHYLNIQKALLLLNVLIAVWDSYATYSNASISNIVPSVCLGIIICNSFWIFFGVINISDDLKNEKERLKRLEEMTDNNLLKGAISQHDSAQAHYERAAEEFYKRMEELSKNLPENSEITTTET